MFVYEKRLQYPIRIKQTNPKLAKIIITQYGGAYFKCYDCYFLVLQLITYIWSFKVNQFNKNNFHVSKIALQQFNTVVRLLLCYLISLLSIFNKV